MEQDERGVLDDPCEGVNTDQGGEPRDSTAVLPGEVAGADVGASKKQHLEEPDTEPDEQAAAASGSVDSEAFENPVAIAAPFEFRSAAADATPPRTSLRALSRGRKLAGLMRFNFNAAGDSEPAGSVSAVLGASSSSAPLTGTHEEVSSRDDRMLKRAWTAPRATVAIAHASPPDSYRRVPSRSRKQYSPKRFVAAAGAWTSAAAPPPAAIPGSTLPSASASGLPTAKSSGAIDASAPSSSSRLPSRGRKQRRPEHFIPEEAAATASAKARRSDIVLDRFLSSVIHGTPASDSEWVSNVITAKDAAVRGQHRPNHVEGFRIRDAHARARGLRAALSRLGDSCVDDPFSSAQAAAASAASGSPPAGEPDGRRGFYGALAVLGASLALSVASCVLFYVVGGRSGAGPFAEQPDENG